MATLSKDGKYVTVVKGDTLWNIAKTHLGAGSKYKQLATWNNISNPDFIVVGQKIYLSSTAASSSSSSKTSSNSSSPTVNTFGMLSTSNDKLIATWTWSKEKYTESYKVLWCYTTLDGVTLVGSNSTITVDHDVYAASRQSEYTIPSGAAYVYFKVKPISKVKDEKKKTTYFTANWSAEKKYTVTTPLAIPSNLKLELDTLKLTASVSGVKSPSKQVQFQLYKNNTTYDSSKTVNISNSETGYASCIWSAVEEGCEYIVRCRAIKDNVYSEWSSFSSGVRTRPTMPSGITTCKSVDKSPDGKFTVYLEWPKANTAESYKIQYTTKKEYFDKSSEVTEVTTKNTAYYVTGIEPGKEYFFRVQSIGANNQESPWTEPVSIILGSPPQAPTTWSSTTTATVGETVKLYWVHNSEDGSSETWADLELYVGEYITDASGNRTFDGTKIELDPIQNTATGDEKDKTKFYDFDTSKYEEGTVLEWRVRTAGISNTFGDWSVKRTIDIHAQPTLKLNIKSDPNAEESIEEISSFPFYILAIPGPVTQNPIGYHVSVTANESYETVDAIGNPVTINAGEEVYSKFFDIDYELEVVMSADNIDLEKNVSYTITVMVTMNSGLNAEESVTLPVTWSENMYTPNAEISVNTDDYTAYITPYCNVSTNAHYQVIKTNGVYILTDTDLGFVSPSEVFHKVTYSKGMYRSTDEIIDCAPGIEVATTYLYGYGSNATIYRSTDDNDDIVYYHKVNPANGAYTTTGEQVFYGIDSNGNEVFFSEVEVVTESENIELSVYRREFDGSFTEIASGIDGANRTTATDPHPSLDYARYRIIATSKDTGAVGYYDMPGYYIGGKEVVIQWNEAWTNFDVEEDAEVSEPPWSGSLLKLPYNIDVSDSHSPDVSLIEYAGRSHPVSYYGTHRGETSTWNVEINKSDKETLYALRRLATWMGDVYVREPSGSSYWANIVVGFSQRHCEVTIPVTLSIKRVEGGV